MKNNIVYRIRNVEQEEFLLQYLHNLGYQWFESTSCLEFQPSVNYRDFLGFPYSIIPTAEDNTNRTKPGMHWSESGHSYPQHLSIEVLVLLREYKLQKIDEKFAIRN